MANSCETVPLILGGGHRQCHPRTGFSLEYSLPSGGYSGMLYCNEWKKKKKMVLLIVENFSTCVGLRDWVSVLPTEQGDEAS